MGGALCCKAIGSVLGGDVLIGNFKIMLGSLSLLSTKI